MAIEITKQGRTANKWKVEVVCERCECEFKCDNTDFQHGRIKCPNCGNEIEYANTITAKKASQEHSLTEMRIDTITDLSFNEIDFEKIHKYMKWSKWKWATSKSDDGVPTIDELKSQVRDLITDAIKRKATISTGGFTVEYREYEENEEDPSTIGVVISFNCERITVDISKDTLEAVYF